MGANLVFRHLLQDVRGFWLFLRTGGPEQTPDVGVSAVGATIDSNASLATLILFAIVLISRKLSDD